MGLINMDFLKKFNLSNEDIDYIKTKYDNKVIARNIYNHHNV